MAVARRSTVKASRRRTVRGMVLWMTLVLLLAVSLLALMAMRSATSTEQIARSLRSHAAALASAEWALRHCEDQLLRGKPRLQELDLPDAQAWKLRPNWAAASPRVNLLALPSPARPRAAEAQPRCMVETLRLPAQEGESPEAYRVTAVGFSADFRKSDAGHAVTGAEVWLQSVLRP